MSERDERALALVEATGFWNIPAKAPYQRVLKVQHGVPNAWIGLGKPPNRRDRHSLLVCVTVQPYWEEAVHGEGCAVVEGAFILGVQWDRGHPKFDLAGRCVAAMLTEASLHPASTKMVQLSEMAIAGHGGFFALALDVEAAGHFLVAKIQQAYGAAEGSAPEPEGMPF